MRCLVLCLASSLFFASLKPAFAEDAWFPAIASCLKINTEEPMGTAKRPKKGPFWTQAIGFDIFQPEPPTKMSLEGKVGDVFYIIGKPRLDYQSGAPQTDKQDAKPTIYACPAEEVQNLNKAGKDCLSYSPIGTSALINLGAYTPYIHSDGHRITETTTGKMCDPQRQAQIGCTEVYDEAKWGENDPLTLAYQQAQERLQKFIKKCNAGEIEHLEGTQTCFAKAKLFCGDLVNKKPNPLRDILFQANGSNGFPRAVDPGSKQPPVAK